MGATSRTTLVAGFCLPSLTTACITIAWTGAGAGWTAASGAAKRITSASSAVSWDKPTSINAKASGQAFESKGILVNGFILRFRLFAIASAVTFPLGSRDLLSFRMAFEAAEVFIQAGAKFFGPDGAGFADRLLCARAFT